MAAESELAFLFVDLGDPFYRGATHLMVQSAKLVMKDVRYVQMTDSETQQYPGSDGFYTTSDACDAKSLCEFKGLIIADRAMKTDLPTVFCDVDMIWNRQPKIPDADIGVMWRPDLKSMPYNSGVIFSRPTNGARMFWAEYANVVREMPSDLKRWYGDQMALAVMLGQQAPGRTVSCCGAQVEVLDMEEIAAAPADVPDRWTDSCAAHFKGPRKAWMADYAKLVGVQ